MADIEKRMMSVVNAECKTGVDSAIVKAPESGNKSGVNNAAKSVNPERDNADKPKRHGIDNLKPQNTRTKEEQRLIATQGGKASGEARRKKKELKERCKILLEMMPNKELIAKSLGSGAELPENADMYDLMIAKMMQDAILEGNVKAAEFVRDSAGDKPTDKTEVNAAVMTAQDLEMIRNIERRVSAENGQKPE